jgi:peptidoglycan hydrolase-like protein with peptidoglycan-binding domain
VLLAILIVIALTADTRSSSAAPGGEQTRAAVRAFQEGRRLPVDGVLGTTTWSSLLNFAPVRSRWAGRRAKRGGGATASRALPSRRPLSASLPAKAYEIDPGPAP